MPNKFALVTGGSSGIGLCFANRLAQLGYNLVIVSNQYDILPGVCASLQEKYPDIVVFPVGKDLAEEGAADMLFQKCADEGWVIDVLVNNAGIFSFKEISDTEPRKIDLFIALHISVVTHLSRLFAEDMARRGGGYILNMSSMSCWMPMPGIGLYAATKAYIRVFTRSLHLEMKERGVKIMVACPGGIATDLFGLSHKLLRFGVAIKVLADPQRFVNKALKRLFKGRKQYINNGLNHCSIFFVSILPDRVKLIVRHKLLHK